MKLRPYQANAVRELLLHRLRTHRRVVAVGPTGCGKTTIAAALIKATKGQRVLWLAHRVELLRQARRELIVAGLSAKEVGILSGSEKLNPTARVLVASVQMFAHRDPPDVDLVVVDEAHRIEAPTYQKLLAALPKARLLGLTATPLRTDGLPLENSFDDMLVMADIVELIADGHIAQPICYGLSREKAKELTKGVSSDGKDFAKEQLGKALSKRALVGDIVSECAKHAPNQATLVFASSCAHARTLETRFAEAGRAVDYLDGDTPNDERAAILARLASGETQVVVNVDVLSEGFDCPRVKCIVLARPTKSLTRFLQQVGRASRTYKGRSPIILDHAGNCWRFGLPETPRAWSLKGEEKESSGGGDMMRHCESCGNYCAIGCKVCPSCGAAFPVDTKELEERKAELERLAARESEKAAALKRIEEIAKKRNAPEGWAKQVLAEMFP